MLAKKPYSVTYPTTCISSLEKSSENDKFPQIISAEKRTASTLQLQNKYN